MRGPGFGIRGRVNDLLMRTALGAVSRVSTGHAVAALTFDDGPHPDFTPRLLRILGKHHARATFFMVGKAAARYPKLVRRVAADGHAIGNHSWDHPSFPLLSGRERRAQIRACAEALAPYGRPLFRPPYGHLDIASRLDTLRLRYEVIGWSFGGEDWLDRDADWMADRLAGAIRPGSIIVLHDALYHVLEERYADRGPLLEAVDRLLGGLGEAFRFVTVPDLLREGKPHRRRSFGKVDIAFLNSLSTAVGEPRRYPEAHPGAPVGISSAE